MYTTSTHRILMMYCKCSVVLFFYLKYTHVHVYCTHSDMYNALYMYIPTWYFIYCCHRVIGCFWPIVIYLSVGCLSLINCLKKNFRYVHVHIQLYIHVHTYTCTCIHCVHSVKPPTQDTLGWGVKKISAMCNQFLNF